MTKEEAYHFNNGDTVIIDFDKGNLKGQTVIVRQRIEYATNFYLIETTDPEYKYRSLFFKDYNSIRLINKQSFISIF